MELTDCGKFIEVEREAIEKTIENGNGSVREGNGDVKDAIEKEDTDLSTIDNDESLKSDVVKYVSASPSQSPGKTVRINENGAKMNGDNGEAVRFLCGFLTNFINCDVDIYCLAI